MKTTKPTAAAAASVKPIDICQAREEAKQWQSMNGTRAKAFLVKTGDFLECMKEMGIASYDAGTGNYTVHEKVGSDLRIYMGTKIDKTTWTDPKEGYGNKLLIVGTTYDSKTKKWSDIIDRTSMCPTMPGYRPTDPVLGSPTGSGVYDFTVPCPNECDPNPGSL